MRILCFFAVTLFSASVLATDFQITDFVLGSKKADLNAEVLSKTSLTLFEAQATVETQWTGDRLQAVLLTYYQGQDYVELRRKFSALQQQFITVFGSLTWVSSEVRADATQTPEQQLALLDQVMQTAPEITEGYRQSHLANSTLTLDFQPELQPANSRLHLQVSFSSTAGEYSLIVFVDEKTTAERTAAAVVNLEAF
ncbi:hypothetical protein EMM73_10540 [Rheinheimera sediminis]|uniref:hypothetical protein n=1 Tax=Rheinheimera sp. YQF-1 TaxID=2499626 RepID=UPI000FD9A803|nr:hypothetical protein [Rheinheimera sp. YQF-1]RVT46131.1 hypothetical protein EMM73_10540 [Rheinheimera sp. YQF-1]